MLARHHQVRRSLQQEFRDDNFRHPVFHPDIGMLLAFKVVRQSLQCNLGVLTLLLAQAMDIFHGDAGELQLALDAPEIVFARVTAEQKMLVVEALRHKGEIVAMTGDGVNDAPALKAAHIGVAMGNRGTDVAREAAGLVLLRDDFASLVATVRLGRRIYDNLRRAMSYVLAVHLPIVGMTMLPIMLGGPLLLMPAHIMFLELIIGPACSIFFEAEAEEKNIMRRPPRAATETLFGGRQLVLSLVQGGIAFCVAAAVFIWGGAAGYDEDTVRALVFTSMVAGNIALVFGNRTQNASGLERNPTLRWILLGTGSALVLVLSVPLLRDLFHFSGSLSPMLLTGLFAAASVYLLVMAVKRAMRSGA